MQGLRQRPAAARTARAAFSSRPGRRRALRVCNMFTGIVQGLAEVTAVDRKQNFSALKISFPPGKMDGVQIGASVAINGTCLTVTNIAGDTVGFDVMVETLRATSLGDLDAGTRVNFERSARVGDEIGGHNVSGHVHFKASIHRVEKSENNQKLTFSVPDDRWMKYILPKGYISVDGCSLTVGEVWDTFFTVYLIPETLRVTVFGFKQEGDSVNIEIESQTQAIVDTVERVVARYMSKA
jgi:riboflavin synthase